ncbi:TetR/AcrR family transcriptional regulator [Candidatus Mycobacterium wuenschmannii]|uniref:TetR/AcrR family transcriptional regulator n=1 Tax=Candidatus Mycobacterium wuenschmannii TaxID=3027808 RepID=A0ABY8VWZ1_9MYCO|nr:TetR/AcrR family transcriptional regulator [Candidatus Mycobacterium wuenschmannii]WIM87314.1 TetR/AcrR family transcriptional regulator [Candidatus Mycobacterium wuenschmannii]
MTTTANDVPTEVVDAALRAAENLGRDVADVSLVAIAREAGMSRSTLLRRLDGSRQPLDDAVRAAGVEPGGRPPVRERAIVAAGAVISDRGLAVVTLEAVAAQADCSVHSLYAAFGGRDELLRSVFDRYGPIVDLEEAVADPNDDLATTVHRIYRLLAEVFSREPRVAPAMLAEVLARPTGPMVQTLAEYIVPRMLAGPGQWLASEVAAGRIRDLPIPLLIQQMLGPIAVHTMARPVLDHAPEVELPDLDEACTVFADNFLRAVAT